MVIGRPNGRVTSADEAQPVANVPPGVARPGGYLLWTGLDATAKDRRVILVARAIVEGDLAELLVTVILRVRPAQRIGDVAGAFGPFAPQSDIGRHRLEGEHEARHHETLGTADAPLDALGIGVGQVVEDSFDVRASIVGKPSPIAVHVILLEGLVHCWVGRGDVLLIPHFDRRRALEDSLPRAVLL